MQYLSLPRAFEKTAAINSSISRVEQQQKKKPTELSFFFWLSDTENTDKVWTIGGPLVKAEAIIQGWGRIYPEYVDTVKKTPF